MQRWFEGQPADQRLAARRYCRIDSGDEDREDQDHPDQRVGHRVLQRPRVRRRGAAGRCCRTARGRPGSPPRPGSTRRTSSAARAGCSVGTNVFATNVSGKITMNEALLTTSGAAHQQADAAPSPRRSRRRTAAAAGSRRSASRNEERIRQPTSRPVSDITTRHDRRCCTTSRDGAADQHRRRRHRQRPEPVDDALLQVLGEAGAGEGRRRRPPSGRRCRRSGTPGSHPAPGSPIALPNT